MASDPSPNSTTATGRTSDRLRDGFARVRTSRWTKAALALAVLGVVAIFAFWFAVMRACCHSSGVGDRFCLGGPLEGAGSNR